MLIVAYSESPEKPLEWMGSSHKDIRECSDEVRNQLGKALRRAQQGRMDSRAKPMKGRLRDVVEISADEDRATYRAMYTAKFAGVIYVLHVFQKKSTQGISTPKRELRLIMQRLTMAHAHYRLHYAGGDDAIQTKGR